MTKNLVVKIFLGLPIFLLSSLTAQAAESPTIASTSLCGDSYLLAIAPDNISALSWQSRSPLSHANEIQRELPQLWDDPEILAASTADIVLMGSGEGQYFKPDFQDVITLQWGESFETIERNAAMIEEALRRETPFIKLWKQRLKQLEIRASKRTVKPKILYISRSGGSAGKGTLVDAAITAAGGINIVKTSGWFTPDPEQVIAYEPDLIVTSYFKNGYESVQSTAVRNKTVQRFMTKHTTLEINGNLWPCAGPGLIEAAELMAEAIDNLP